MIEYISQVLKQAAHEAIAPLYSFGIDPFLEDLAKDADRVFYFEDAPVAQQDICQKIDDITTYVATLMESEGRTMRGLRGTRSR